MTAGYSDAQFDSNGTYLLCAAKRDAHHIEVQLREAEGCSVVNRVLVADSFGGSNASFHPTALPDTWTLWVAAGQEGQCVYWLKCEGGSLRVRLEPCLENTIPPAFSPGGDEYLTIETGGPLHRYRYPQTQLLGTCDSLYGEEDLFDSVCYLDNARALARSVNGRIALIDTPTMRVVKDVIVEGHLPRPVEECYPKLAGDKQLCTDISYFVRIANHLIIIYPLRRPTNRGRDGTVKFEEWRDALLCFPAEYVLEQCEGPAPVDGRG
jgi:hypothetical protein